MRLQVWIGALVALVLGATTAHAADNPFYGAYGGDVVVADVTVTYADDILESHSDRAAQAFVANESFPADLRTAFEAFAAERGGATESAYAERFSEFLVTRSLRAKATENPGTRNEGTRRVRLEVNVTDARINGMISGAFFGGAAFPRLEASMRIIDAESGAVLASADIRNAQSWNPHNEAAAALHGFRYNSSGTDTNFRLLAGSTEALSAFVFHVLEAPSFSDERIVISSYPRVAIRPPVFNVTLAAQ